MSRELISPEGLRADGRRAHELRRVEVRLGALAWSGGSGGGGAAATAVDGAAYFAQGNTKVLAFVVGPRETKLRSQALPDRCSISCEYSVAPFSFSERKQVSKSDRRSTEMALLLRQSFESVILTTLYPGSHLSLHVQVLQNDGAALAASVNALTLALQNAGIPMRDMLCAASVGLGEQSTPVLDLNFSERGSDTPEITCASLVHSEKIVLLTEENKLQAQHLQPMVELALQANQKIFAILKQETKAYSEAILRSRGIINA